MVGGGRGGGEGCPACLPPVGWQREGEERVSCRHRPHHAWGEQGRRSVPVPGRGHAWAGTTVPGVRRGAAAGPRLPGRACGTAGPGGAGAERIGAAVPLGASFGRLPAPPPLSVAPSRAEGSRAAPAPPPSSGRGGGSRRDAAARAPPLSPARRRRRLLSAAAAMERRAEAPAPPPQGLDFTVENVEKVSEPPRVRPCVSRVPPPPAHPRRWRGGGTRLRDADAAAGVRGLRLGVGVGGHLLGGVGPEEGGGAASPLSRRPCPQRGRRGPACAPGGGPVRGAGGGAGGSCAPGQPGEGK